MRKIKELKLMDELLTLFLVIRIWSQWKQRGNSLWLIKPTSTVSGVTKDTLFWAFFICFTAYSQKSCNLWSQCSTGRLAAKSNNGSMAEQQIVCIMRFKRIANVRRMRPSDLLCQGSPEGTLARSQEPMQTLQHHLRRQIWTVTYIENVSPLLLCNVE